MADGPAYFLAQQHRVSKPADIDDLGEHQLRVEAAALHRVGARTTSEFILELARDHLLATALLAKLRRYNTRLTPAMLAVTGGDRMPAAPIHSVIRDDEFR